MFERIMKGDEVVNVVHGRSMYATLGVLNYPGKEGQLKKSSSIKLLSRKYVLAVAVKDRLEEIRQRQEIPLGVYGKKIFEFNSSGNEGSNKGKR